MVAKVHKKSTITVIRNKTHYVYNHYRNNDIDEIVTMNMHSNASQVFVSHYKLLVQLPQMVPLVSLGCREVALHYARTWLIVDVVTAIPFEYVPGLEEATATTTTTTRTRARTRTRTRTQQQNPQVSLRISSTNWWILMGIHGCSTSILGWLQEDASQ